MNDPIEIPLSHNQISLISPDDIDLASLSWKALPAKSHGYYAVSAKTRNIRMHRLILERMLDRPLIKGEECDHIDLNKLNNQRNNLRLATKAQNKQNASMRSDNKSGYKGVCWHKAGHKWQAKIGVNGKQIYLGLFETAQEAYAARCEAALKYHGEFARG